MCSRCDPVSTTPSAARPTTRVEPDRSAMYAVRGRRRISSAEPALREPPVLDDVDLIGQEEGLGRVMGDEKPRSIEAGEVHGKRAAQLRPGRHVERREWLVEEKQTRLGHERPRKGDPLRLATGQAARATLGHGSQPHPFEPLLCRCTRLAFGTPRLRRPNATFSMAVRCGNSRPSWNTTPMRHSGASTKREPDASSSVSPASLIHPSSSGRSPARAQDRGGLPGAVRTEERSGAPGRDRQREVEAERRPSLQTSRASRPPSSLRALEAIDRA